MKLDGLVKTGVRRTALVRRFLLAPHEAHLLKQKWCVAFVEGALFLRVVPLHARLSWSVASFYLTATFTKLLL